VVIRTWTVGKYLRQACLRRLPELMTLIACFYVVGPTFWNSLSDDLRDPHPAVDSEYFSAGLENASIHWTSRSVSALGVFYVTALYRSTFSYLLTYSATFHLYCALAPPVIVIDWSGQRSEEDLRIYTRSR